jgi:hypothetical protein
MSHGRLIQDAVILPVVLYGCDRVTALQTQSDEVNIWCNGTAAREDAQGAELQCVQCGLVGCGLVKTCTWSPTFREETIAFTIRI